MILDQVGERLVRFDPVNLAQGDVEANRREIVAHCPACLMQRIIDEGKGRFVIVHTSPPCLLDRARGELVDVFPPEEECSRLRARAQRARRK